jgi:hypothetical protein
MLKAGNNPLAKGAADNAQRAKSLVNLEPTPEICLTRKQKSGNLLVLDQTNRSCDGADHKHSNDSSIKK